MNEVQRIAFLRKCYQLTDGGKPNRHCQESDEVGNALGLDEKTVRDIVQYWEDEGHIKWHRGGFLEFTSSGRMAARELFEGGEAPETEEPPGPPTGFRP